MVIPTRLEPIVERLSARTEEGKIRWIQGASKWEFLATLGDASVSIQDAGDTKGQRYRLALFNEDGAEVDAATAIRPTQSTSGENDFAYQQLSSLWEGAKFTALDVGKAIKTIEDALDRL